MTFLPIVERELRIAARRPGTYWLRCGAATVAILVMALMSAGMYSRMSAAMKAKETFCTLSAITMVFCLVAGMFQTADCLSSEKREGTLGLLFLTDLHSYDVVLGKLAANSVHACYGLVAMLPILAIPLLAGGVTVGEFWRVVVVLLASLFFSLGVGVFVSSVTRETRQALALSALLVIFISGLLPAIYQLIWLLTTARVSAPLLWPSAGYALTMAYDSYYSYRTGAGEFWGSIFTIIGLGFAGLAVAGFLLPRAWQEKSQSSRKAGSVSLWRRMRFGCCIICQTRPCMMKARFS